MSAEMLNELNIEYVSSTVDVLSELSHRLNSKNTNESSNTGSSTPVLVSKNEHETILALGVELNGVPMGFLEGIGFIATLSLAQTLNIQINDDTSSVESYGVHWPFLIVRNEAPIAEIYTKAQYNGSLFGLIKISCFEQMSVETVEAVAKNNVNEFKTWQRLILQKKIVAGPLAHHLNTYFDMVTYMGSDVTMLLSNKTVQKMRFAGLDMWGRACVIDQDGVEHTYSHAQAEVISSPQDESFVPVSDSLH